MAYSSTQTVATSKSPDDVVAAAQRAFASMGLMAHTQGTTVSASSGSTVLTMILGFLSPENNMPVRVTVDAGTGGTAQITAVDTYPIPLTLGIHGKRRRRAEALAQQMQQALQQQLSA
jgi:hypothetical protein